MHEKKQILYITDSGFDTNNPTQHLQITVIKDLIKYGYKVHFVFSYERDPNYLPPELVGIDGLTYTTIKHRKASKHNFVLRYLNGMLFSLIGARKIKRAQKQSCVTVLQSSATAIFTMVILRAISKKPVIYNEYDIFPGEIYDNGTLKSKFIYDVLQSIQNNIYRMSNRIITLTLDTKKTLLKIGVPNEKIEIIPTWYDINSILPVSSDRNRFIEKYGIDKNKFIVQFAGTLGYVFDYHAVLQTAEALIDNRDIEFHMIW
ncbi:MAG: glycosyltransferase [Pelotomaculum sp.]